MISSSISIGAKAQSIDDQDFNEIYKVIDTYFDLKYTSHTNNKFPDLSSVF
jgi:hypothetical protein